MQKIAENCYTIGKIVSHSLTPDESMAISSSGLAISATQTVQKFERLMISNVIYCGDEYTRSRSRNNTMCIIQLEEGSIQYGCIKSFFLLEHHTIPFCFLEKLHQTGNSPLTNVRPPRNRAIRDTDTARRLCNQIAEVNFKSLPTLLAIPVTCIKKKCVILSVPIQGQPVSHYLIPVPNSYELH